MKLRFNSKNYKQLLSAVSADRIVSISAIIVSLGTLFLITYQTVLTRKAQKASALPYLITGVSIDSDKEMAYVFLTNKGLGPAFIEKISIHYQNHEINGDPFTFYKTLYSDSIGKKHLYIDRVFPGRVISKNERIKMLGVVGSEQKKDELFHLFYKGNKDNMAVVEIIYSSVYGDKWKIRSDGYRPEELD